MFIKSLFACETKRPVTEIKEEKMNTGQLSKIIDFKLYSCTVEMYAACVDKYVPLQ